MPITRFVDRDMLMRYLGMGVGHSYATPLPDDESAPCTGNTEDEDPEDLSTSNPVAERSASGADNVDHDPDATVWEEDTYDDEDGEEDGDEDDMDDEDVDLGPEDGEDDATDEFNYEDV